MARGLSVAAMGIFICSCSLFTDLGGFDRGAEATSSTSADAATDAPSSALDASSLPDGATVGEGGPDASESSLLCAPGSKHVFCTTFDTLPLEDEFDTVSSGLGAIAREQGPSTSGPFALRIDHPGGSPATTPSVYRKLAVTGFKGLHCKLRYRRELVGGGTLVLLILNLTTTASSQRVFAEIKDGPSSGRVYIETTQPNGDKASDFPVIPTFSAPGDTWADLDWTLDFTTSKSALRRGTDLIDARPFAGVDGSSFTAAEITLGLGNFESAASPWKVRLDDVVCDDL